MTALMRQRWTRSCAQPIGTPVNTKTTGRHHPGDKLLTFLKDL
jgi:hypothetical protein